MATLTPQQWIAKMDARINELASDKLFAANIYNVLSISGPRIFEKGLNGNNVKIGTYSKRAIYVNPKTDSPKSFGVLGKNGKSTFKNGNKHKTRYFSGGYKQFKGQIGKGTAVNLWLRGELKSDYYSQTLRKVNNGYDFILKKQINIDKVDWFKSRFSRNIFKLTKQERAKFEKDYKTEVLRILNN